ncbi:MAG: HEAT repeat domain-containing protein [Elainella sp.]
MPRPNYGPEAKKRSQTLLAVLLAYANDELDWNELDESALDRLRPQIQTHWQSECRLVVRTKLRFLEALLKLAGQPLTLDQIKEALKRLEDWVGVLEDNRPSRGGSEVWHFTLVLWHSRNNASANLTQFEAEWEARRSQKAQSGRNQGQDTPASAPLDTSVEFPIAQPPASPSTAAAVDWLDLCRTNLQAQQYERLTTNPLTVADGLSFALEQVYLPLDLVERRQQERREQEVSPSRGSQLYEAEEEAVRLSVQGFLDLLTQADQPQRLAIVGEPGAGKTTLLQKTAAGLLARQVLPIWVSLADLQGQTLEQYLLNDWLKAATRKVMVPPEFQMGLGEQFNQGRVWLLLDAVDEMALEPSSALALIGRQLRGWVADAHVILTCRSNVWDSSKNALENFTVYRNANFGPGESSDRQDQISLFIQRWFAARPELGNQLQAALAQRRRIRDMVRNPLRLALLCRAWSMAQGQLPQTTTALYQQFVEALYDWKQDRFPTTLVQRQQLNQALADLALKALSQENMRFRLRHSFVQQTLGGASGHLLEQALQLGWLNQVGLASTELGSEKIYAFYHPTFQEYFAAQAVSDWRFFLDSQAVFSSQWRQPILLWLGRVDVAAAAKAELITALTQFEDNCGGFFNQQVYLLAATGLAEFPNAPDAEAMIQQLIRWRFGEFDPALKTWKVQPVPLQEAARIALLQTDRAGAIAGLEQFLKTCQSPFARWTAAYSLGKTLDPGNALAIQTLTELLDLFQQDLFQIQLSEALGRIEPGNQRAIATLTHLVTTLESEKLRRKAAYSLGKIDSDNQAARDTLIHLSQFSLDAAVKQQAAESLRSLGYSIQLPKTVQDKKPDTIPSTRRSRKQPKPEINQQRIILGLEDRLSKAQNAEAQRRFAYQLGNLQPGHPLAVATLLKLMATDQPPRFYKRTGEYLQAAVIPEQLAVMVPHLRAHSLQETCLEQGAECHKLLWYCAQQLSYRQFQAAWSAPAMPIV